MSHQRDRSAAWCALLLGAGAWTAAAVTLVRGALDGLAAARSGDVDLDSALGGLAALTGLGVLAWTALAAGATLLAALLPVGTAAADRARRWSERITPVAMRRVLALLVGAAIASGAVPAEAATAGAPAARVVATVPVDVRPGHRPAGLDPSWGAPLADPAPRLGAAPPERRGHVALDPTWAPAGRLRAGVDPGAGAVVVRRGDSLWDIAARHLGPSATDAEIAHSWPQWYRANRALIGPDPDLLRPGQRLVPPSSTTGGDA